jgi:hypothetical protein
MDITPEELDKRKRLWSAFSDLWLDTEISQMTRTYIVREMKDSGYSLVDLKHIYQHEVAPVVYRNLNTVTGEWAGFNEEWLHEEIQKNINKPNWWKKFWFYINQSTMFYATKEEWDKLEELFHRDINYDQIN